MRHWLGFAIPLALMLVTGCKSSSTEENRIVQAFATNAGGVALDGYDPLSYFAEAGPALGSEAISSRWRGASFWFASAENRVLFEADPERHAPQFGGHCAFGLSMNQAVSADPRAWTLRGGKLYLNASPGVRFIWRLLPGVVARAERNWARLQAKP